MYIPKKYGSYKVDRCPFCDKQAIAKSKQGVPVCLSHKDLAIEDFRCQCNGYLDLMDGKFGPYFKCMKCGNISFSRALEMNKDKINAVASAPKEKVNSSPSQKHNVSSRPTTNERKETVVTSDQVDIYFS
jgi:hypothetical protein